MAWKYEFLIDYNLIGHAKILFSSIESDGWLEDLPIRFVFFDQIGLARDSDDRLVWQTAQSNQMVLLTGNRKMRGYNSLEQVLQ